MERGPGMGEPSGDSEAETTQEKGAELFTCPLMQCLQVVLKRPAQQEMPFRSALLYP